jgi:hypothetical protein
MVLHRRIVYASVPPPPVDTPSADFSFYHAHLGRKIAATRETPPPHTSSYIVANIIFECAALPDATVIGQPGHEQPRRGMHR